VGTVEVVAGVLTDPGIGWADYGRFLLWTTSGNTAGGVLFVAVIKYGHAVKSA
jgi:formate/nitrite transporter FocA (FNT family)